MTGGRGDDFGHGKYRDGGQWGEDSQHTDAIVLGEVGNQGVGHGEEQAYTDLAQNSSNVDPDGFQNVGSGRMQQVGDKWVFKRESGHEGS